MQSNGNDVSKAMAMLTDDANVHQFVGVHHESCTSLPCADGMAGQREYDATKWSRWVCSDKIVLWLFLGAGPVALPEGCPSGSEKGERFFLPGVFRTGGVFRTA